MCFLLRSKICDPVSIVDNIFRKYLTEDMEITTFIYFIFLKSLFREFAGDVSYLDHDELSLPGSSIGPLLPEAEADLKLGRVWSLASLVGDYACASRKQHLFYRRAFFFLLLLIQFAFTSDHQIMTKQKHRLFFTKGKRLRQ